MLEQSIVFNLKIPFGGNFTPYIYGNIPELGFGCLENAHPMKRTGKAYDWNFSVDISSKSKKIWYKYAIKHEFGGFKEECTSYRYLPENVGRTDMFDIFEKPQPIGSVLIRFRILYKTYFGQELWINGDIPELGNFVENNGLKLTYFGNEEIWVGDIAIPLSNESRKINFRYFVTCEGKETIYEPCEAHSITIPPTNSPTLVEINDCFRWSDPIQDALVRAPYCNVFNKRTFFDSPLIYTINNEANTVKIRFAILCSVPKAQQHLYLVGSCPELGEWNPHKGVKLNDSEFPIWSSIVHIPRDRIPFEYKYVMLDLDGKVFWESRFNRMMSTNEPENVDVSFPISLMCNDWMPSLSQEAFKAAGVSINLLRMRSENSCGCGQISDICRLVDLSNAMGASLIDLTPINDTTTDGDWSDMNLNIPISSFAIHPIFIDLMNLRGNLSPEIITEIKNNQYDLEENSKIDYPNVYRFKMDVLKKIFDSQFDEISHDSSFKSFVEKENQWLLRYSLFCVFRDMYNTTNYENWDDNSEINEHNISDLLEVHNESVLFYSWIQYNLDQQLRQVYEYATNKCVCLRIEFPVGVARYSADTWTWPNIFKHQVFAGIPPSRSNPQGINLKAAAPDWQAMATYNFGWWKYRLQRISSYFHSIQVDRIYDFFRTWEIKDENDIQGLIGYFDPDYQITHEELDKLHLWDVPRYTKPYIRSRLLPALFGSDSKYVENTFFDCYGRTSYDSLLEFKPGFRNESAIRDFLIGESNTHLEKGLFELFSNICLVEDANNMFHIRRDSHFLSSLTLKTIPQPQRSILKDMHFKCPPHLRHDCYESIESSNRLEITSADSVIPPRTRVIPYRIQRQSPNDATSFDDVRNLPYQCVATPSTEHISSIRKWWEENYANTQKFWNNELWRHGSAPSSCEPWIQEMIVRQHLWSNAMWAVFSLFDLAGLDKSLVLLKPEHEHDPSFRIPWKIEDLKNSSTFTRSILIMINESSRMKKYD